MSIKQERILSDYQKVNDLKDNELIDQETRKEGSNEHQQLVKHNREICYRDYFGSNQGHYSDRCGPQGSAKEFHDNFKDHRKESDHHLRLIPLHLAKDSAE